MKLLGAEADANTAGLARLPGVSNNFIGRDRPQLQTTARYAHLAADAVNAAAERVSSNIAALVDSRSAEIVPLRSTATER